MLGGEVLTPGPRSRLDIQLDISEGHQLPVKVTVAVLSAGGHELWPWGDARMEIGQKEREKKRVCDGFKERIGMSVTNSSFRRLCWSRHATVHTHTADREGCWIWVKIRKSHSPSVLLWKPCNCTNPLGICLDRGGHLSCCDWIVRYDRCQKIRRGLWQSEQRILKQEK